MYAYMIVIKATGTCVLRQEIFETTATQHCAMREENDEYRKLVWISGSPIFS